MSVLSSSGCGVGLAPGSTGCGSSLTVLRSSAVPVLPATLTPGTAAPMPVPSVTTARMKRAITAAVRVLAARVSLPWAPRESTGATRRPRRPMVAATVASSSGVASTLPWPIADEPTARSSPISSGAGIVERAAPTGPGILVEAEALGGLDEAAGADLGPQRREHRVAGFRERALERAAARLAVGVLELHALERGLRLDREARARPDLAGLQRGGQRDDLERRAGRLGRRERDAREAQHLAGLGPQHGDAAEAPGQRLDRRALDVGVDRRADVDAALRLRARHHALPGAQHAAGAPGQPRVELALEAGEPDRRALGHAALLELGGAVGRRRADAAGDLGGQRAEVRQAVGALGQRRAVAREDVAALAERRLARRASRRGAGRGRRARRASRPPCRPPCRPSAAGRCRRRRPKIRVCIATGRS